MTWLWRCADCGREVEAEETFPDSWLVTFTSSTSEEPGRAMLHCDACVAFEAEASR